MSLVTEIRDGFQRLVTEINALKAAPSGGGGPSVWTESFSQRFRARVDGAWMSWGLFGFSDTTIDDNGGGTGINPAVEYDTLGILVRAGTKLAGFDLSGRTNNATVNALDIRIYEQFGDFTGGYGAAGVTRNLIHSADALDFAGQLMHGHFIDLNHTFQQNSMIVVYIRPTNSHTSDRFIYLTETLYFEK